MGYSHSMDLFLIILGSAVLLVGVIGCFLPVIPGPPLAWLSLLALSFTSFGALSARILLLTGITAVLVTILDNVVPVWGTKRFGGSRAGVLGATLGLVAGLFLAPAGLILGPFIGALCGELLYDRSDLRRSVKAAFGALAGFLMGVGLKLAASLWFGGIFVQQLIRHFNG